MISAARIRYRAKLVAMGLAVLVPKPRLTVSQHADRYRVLSADSGAVEPGPWRTDRVPYLREIQDALGDPQYRRVVFKKSSQVGGSELGLNWFQSVVDQAPAPFLVLWPTETMLKLWSTTQLGPLIRDSEVLQKKVVDSQGRRSAQDTMTRKTYPGGYLAALAAKSSSQLRSLKAPYAWADEIDEFDANLRGQGDPLKLLERAQRTFLRSIAKLYIVSTPTVAGFSRIADEYQASDQRHYFVPCPHCGLYQQLHWLDEKRRYRLVCDRDDQGELIPATAKYLCEGCGVLIEERYREEMLRRGQWRATFPDRAVAGFHINTLYSPFVSWAQIVQEFLESKRDPKKLQTFDNLWLGLEFEGSGEKIEPHALAGRAETYEAEVPNGVGLLTGFVDVQGDRLELHEWGWGEAERAWVIQWKVLEGDPGGEQVWEDLEKELARERVHQSGKRMRIAAVTIDANYQTSAVHKFCEPRLGRRIYPTIGRDGRGRPLWTPPSKATKFARGRGRQAQKSYVVGVDSAKDQLASRLRLTEPGPGYISFPTTLDPVFYDQLTAEKLVTVYVHGRPIRKWVKIEGRRNEALDGAVGNMAALASLGGAVIKQLGAYAELLMARGGEAAQQAVAQAPARQRGIRHPGVRR